MLNWLRNIYAVLFGISPVLSLYSHNVAQVAARDVIVPLVVVGTATIVVLLAARWALRGWSKANLFVAVAVLLCFTFGHAQSAIGSWAVGGISMGNPKLLLPVWTLLFLVASWLIATTRKNLSALSKILTFAAVVLVAIPIANVAAYRVFASPNVATETCTDNDLDLTPRGAEAGAIPDIYYIVLDRYSSSSSLAEFYDFDNSEFVDHLTDRGFYVAEESFANYMVTSQSLASSLNFDYINCLTERMGRSSDDWLPLFGMLEDYRVWRFLKARGYRFVHFGTGWHPTARNGFADENYNLYLISEFASLLLQRTVLYPVLVKIGLADVRMEKWKRVNYNFDRLEDMAEKPGPKFVFAHFLVPHDPYVFDKDGTFTPRHVIVPRSREANFTNQLQYTNERVRRVVDALIERSPTPPVIIVQGDEGPYPEACTALDYNWTGASSAEFSEKVKILNAYYLPGVDTSALYPSISPVNTFRVVFNSYFGTNFPLLPDRSYAYVDIYHLYDFFEITDKVR